MVLNSYKKSNTHHRRSIRLMGYDYSQAGLYFITICTYNRTCLFGNIYSDGMILNDAGKMVEMQWLDLKQRFTGIVFGEYIIMPNHFHGIINITRRGEPCVRPIFTQYPEKGEHKVRPYDGNKPKSNGTLENTIGRIIQAFKSMTTVEYIRCVKAKEWQRFNKKLWQRNYYEHIIRNEKSYRVIAEYICNNSLKWQDDKYYA